MQQFKQKKLLFASLGAITITILVLYIWAGAFVLQIFPRNEPQDPARVTNTEELGKDFRNGSYGTLNVVDEKPAPQPSPQPSSQPPNNQAAPPAEPKKSVPGNGRGLLRQFGL